MNFLWDMVLRAKKQGRKEEELFFKQAKEYSPFYEQSFSCINEKEIHTKEIEVNLLYRFADIFQELLSEEDCGLDGGEYGEFREYFIDVILHVLVYTDLRHGLTKREIYSKKLLEEVRNGSYWKGVAEGMELLEEDIQNRLATLLLTQTKTGSSLNHFRSALRILYPDGILYQPKGEKKTLLLYLKEKGNHRDEQILELAKALFLPLGFVLRVFWKYHFGIIGIEATMKLEEIALY